MDPCLIDLKGHNYNNCFQYQKIFEKMGINFNAIGSKSVNLPSPEFNLKGHFQKNLWQLTSKTSNDPAEEIYKRLEYFIHDFNSLEANNNYDEDDLLYFPQVHWAYVEALSLSMLQQNSKNKPNIWIQLMMPCGFDPIGNQIGEIEELVLLKAAILKLELLLGREKIWITAENTKLANYYQDYLGRFVDILPAPTLLDFEKLNDISLNKVINIFVPGKARYEKGIDRVVDLILKVSETRINENVRWFLQGYTQQIDQGLKKKLSSVESLNQVTVIKDPLSHKEYIKLFNKSHIILMPYRKNRYYLRSSGVCNESLISGRVPIATKGTTMASQMEEFDVGCVYDETIEGDLYEKFLYTIKNIDLLTKKSKNERSKITSKYSIDKSFQRIFFENSFSLKESQPRYRAISQRYLFRQLLKGNIEELISKLDKRRITSIALFGGGSHSQEFLSLWPTRIKVHYILVSSICDVNCNFKIPIETLEKVDTNEFDAIILSSKLYEKEMYLKVTEIHPLVPVFGVWVKQFRKEVLIT